MVLNLNDAIQACWKRIDEGQVATYIPVLAKVDPYQLGVCLYNVDSGKKDCAGASNVRFAIESVSKVIALLYAIERLGLTTVEDHLSSFDQILNFTREICNDPQITLNEEIYQSELRTGDMNRSLAYYLKAKETLANDVTTSLEIYFKQCSMMVTCESLANLGAVLANDGIAPWNGERLISSDAATYTKSVMMTTGLYNQSGTYSVKIGVPTKSGVGGGLVASAPKYGIGIFSPALDQAGNSVAGLALLEMISRELDLDIFKY
ncbi:glutaminase [Limosilactobacillus vaginalis]|uniref:glutaminase n=1 Tax=Limosilactobacillus vaginalis TaxID=1633 RepID=UPI0025A49A77|nr:glutaminase [Limosilactobacillus vaginalis]MDM8261802.1 glutaminase [Limosilactobacillus vaginalis]